MNTKTLPDLSGFYGTEHYYRHPLARNTLYTDGVKHLADECGAFSLIDEIAFAQRDGLRSHDFQHCKVQVTGSAATLTCEDGDGGVLQSPDERVTVIGDGQRFTAAAYRRSSPNAQEINNNHENVSDYSCCNDRTFHNHRKRDC